MGKIKPIYERHIGPVGQSPKTLNQKTWAGPDQKKKKKKSVIY